jgi:hypothetical protein
MNILNNLDNSLMKLFTFNYRYKTVADRPQLQLAMLPTIALLFFIYLGDFSFLSIIAYTLLLLSCYYEWRLWFKLRNQSAIKYNNEGN